MKKNIPTFKHIALLAVVLSLLIESVGATETPYTISTFAGGAIPLGDGGPALDGAVNLPRGMAFDAAGNLYIADSRNHRIRKINTSGIITTVAGNGTAGFSGDGGPATSASLNLPWGVAVDQAGQIFIADLLNNRLRKVNSSGIISTVAGTGTAGFSGDGGPAVSAQLNQPARVVVDSLGTVFFIDSVNKRVRKVSPGGVISTVAGGGAKLGSGPATDLSLQEPGGLALKDQQYLLLGDRNVIIKIDLVTAQAYIVAGKYGFADTTLEDGPAINFYFQSIQDVALAANGDFFVADSELFVRYIRKVRDGMLTTVAGADGIGLEDGSGNGGPARQAELAGPHGLALDTSGNLFIADGQSIRRIDAASQIITRFAGTGFSDATAGFGGDGGPATGATFNVPQYITRDLVGNTYLCDGHNNRVRKIDASGIITTVAGNGTAGFSGDGGPATSASLNFPSGVAVDTQGQIFISDNANNRIRKVNSSGNISTVAGTGAFGFSGDGGPATSAQLSSPVGIAVDDNGTIYFVDRNNRRIRKIDASGIITSIAGGGAKTGSGLGNEVFLPAPAGLAIKAPDFLVMTDDSFNLVQKLNLATNQVSVVAGKIAEPILSGPLGVTVDGGGNIFISDTNNTLIKKVDPSGVLTTIAGNGTVGFSGDGGAALQAEFNRPIGLTVDGTGNVYVVDSGNGRIRLLAPSGDGGTPPSITAQPANQTVNAGQTATFSVTATGSAPLSYQWKKNGSSISGATSASYTTPATTSADNGAQFLCVVSNSFGPPATSNAATLTVNSPPTITIQPNGQTVSLGQKATFSVAVSGTPPFQYQWKKNGADIAGATSATYTTPATTSADNGLIFSVAVTNGSGSVTSNGAILTVSSNGGTAPSITTQPANKTVNAGQSATFSVTASGTAPLNYQWRKNGTPISGATSSTYSTSATASSDNGTVFDVTISNSAGNVTSTPATLTVHSPPTITQQPANQVVTVGQTATFSVVASGTDPKSYTWQSKASGSSIFSVILGATAASYTTPPTTLTDNGTRFQVIIENAAGLVTSDEVSLIVKALPGGAPPTPVSSGRLVNGAEGICAEFPGGHTLRIYTTQGTYVKSLSLGNGTLCAADVGDLAAGVYLYELNGSNGKFVVVH